MHLGYTAADSNYALQAKVLLLSPVKTQTDPTPGDTGQWVDMERNRPSHRAPSEDVTVEIRPVDSQQFSQIRSLRCV